MRPGFDETLAGTGNHQIMESRSRAGAPLARSSPLSLSLSDFPGRVLTAVSRRLLLLPTSFSKVTRFHCCVYSSSRQRQAPAQSLVPQALLRNNGNPTVWPAHVRCCIVSLFQSLSLLRINGVTASTRQSEYALRHLVLRARRLGGGQCNSYD